MVHVRPEYLQMKINLFPQGFIEHYKLNRKMDAKGFVYVKCVTGMYGLTHANIIAQELLGELLAKHGYPQSSHNLGV